MASRLCHSINEFLKALTFMLGRLVVCISSTVRHVHVRTGNALNGSGTPWNVCLVGDSTLWRTKHEVLKGRLLCLCLTGTTISESEALWTATPRLQPTHVEASDTGMTSTKRVWGGD